MTDLVGEPCRVVYDLRAVGYTTWPPIAIAAIATVAATFFVWIGMKVSRERKQRGFWLLPAFGTFLTIGGFVSTWTAYHRAVNALDSGDVQRVEGRIENFVPRSITGHSAESFTVDGRRFKYSDDTMRVGFRQSRVRGGPFGPDVYVRLRFRGNDILYAEVCDGR